MILAQLCSALPVEVQKHCLSYIPCKGITIERLEEAKRKLLRLSTLSLITRRIRLWLGHKVRCSSGNEYKIATESGVKLVVNYTTPMYGFWYPIASIYLGDGEYQSLCVHKSGDWVCEWKLGEMISVFKMDVLRLKLRPSQISSCDGA